MMKNMMSTAKRVMALALTFMMMLTSLGEYMPGWFTAFAEDMFIEDAMTQTEKASEEGVVSETGEEEDEDEAKEEPASAPEEEEKQEEAPVKEEVPVEEETPAQEETPVEEEAPAQEETSNQEEVSAQDYIRIEGVVDGDLNVTVKQGQPIWPEWTGENSAADIQGDSYIRVGEDWYPANAAEL